MMAERAEVAITVISDVHLEFSGYTMKNAQGADVLVLSGDIMISQDLHDHKTVPAMDLGFVGLGRRQQAVQRYRDFLDDCCREFSHVIYVAGNHEFYNGKFYAGIEYLREECATRPNLHFLERDAVEIMGTMFVGGTLWTDCNKGDPLTLHSLKSQMNDFRVIRHDKAEYRLLKPEDIMARHHLTLKYFREVIENVRENSPNTPVVVVGHHTPSWQSCEDKYKSDYTIGGGYHSELSEFILNHPEIKLWTCGHTHHAHRYYIGDTHVVCNPRGYDSAGYTEDTGWDPHMVVKI